MQNWSCNYLQQMNMPQKYAPMMEMPQEQLESMYPRCYYIIHPEVRRHVDNFTSANGQMATPTRRQMDEMIDNIDNTVGDNVDQDYRDDDEYETGYGYDNYDERQFGGFGGGFPGHGRRRFRRDLISILLLRELLGRRRPHYGYGWYPY